MHNLIFVALSLVALHHPFFSENIGTCRTRHTGCGEHTDCGFLTILAQDLSGLEVQDPQTQQWKLVQPLENMFAVNLGDMAARWTNDAYKSTKHRVYNQNAKTRYSIPFFCNCNFEAPVECILTDNGSLSLLCDDNDDDDDDHNAGKEDNHNKENYGDAIARKCALAKYEPTTAGAYILERLGFMRK